MANELDYDPGSSNDYYYQFDGGGSGNGYVYLGYDYSIGRTLSSAVRFPGIVLAKNANIDNATLHIRVESRQGTSAVKSRVEGIDEDNTADFSSSPGSRTRTSASITGEYSPSGSGYYDHNVTAMVEEIVARSGWSSGNAIGFWFSDDGTNNSTDNTIFESIYSGENCYLSIRSSAEPDFTPTTSSVAAPSIPTPGTHGIKVSYPGIPVQTATREQLIYTSDEKVFKIIDQGQITSASGTDVIGHDLGYIPFATVYAKSGTSWLKLPDFANFSFNGDYSVNDASLTVYTDVGTVFYYYIFIEELAP